MQQTNTDTAYSPSIVRIINALYSSHLVESDLDNLQVKLDNLAEIHQSDENLGSQRYMLYLAQALIYFSRGNMPQAEAFISTAESNHGGRFEQGDALREQIESRNTGNLPGMFKRAIAIILFILGVLSIAGWFVSALLGQDSGGISAILFPLLLLTLGGWLMRPRKDV